MSTLSLRIPESLHKELKKLSKKDKVSINQFITTALSEKITALETEEFLNERAKRGNLKAYQNILDRVPDDEPEKQDK
jgi:hypothetical protein